MKKYHFVFSAIMIVSMFLSLLASPLFSSNVVKAEIGEGSSHGINAAIVAIPITVSPNGYVWDTTPTYKWIAISGATFYHVQVFKSSTKVLDKYYNNSVCSSGYCYANFTTALSYTSYTWKVRAHVSGAWSAFSPSRSFIVTAGFYSTFTSNTTGWAPVYGTWTLSTTSPGVYKTYGLNDLHSSAVYNGTYSKLDYQARMRRVGCPGCPSYLMIRGIPTPLSSWDRAWYNSYRFGYTNSGSFIVLKYSGAHIETSLQGWTDTPYIYHNTWNTLRVIASGSSLKFYINGHLVWSGTDSGLTSGKVGLGMFGDSSSGDALYVDWAKLVTTFDTAASDMSEPVE